MNYEINQNSNKNSSVTLFDGQCFVALRTLSFSWC